MAQLRGLLGRVSSLRSSARRASVVYPVLPPATLRLADRAALRGFLRNGHKHFGPIVCPTCGRRWVFALDFGDVPGWLRETGTCSQCGATNRHRQLSVVVAGSASAMSHRPIASLSAVRGAGLRVHNTETTGPVHRALLDSPGYSASEYLGPSVQPGAVVEGVRHEDLEDMSFDSDSLDVLISSDVFEHVADPYRAHREVWRVLRAGGRHVFTVPFRECEFLDEQRAYIDQRGELVHVLEPMFHDDPVRPQEGALVFNVFSLEMLVRLREIGFDTRMHWLHSPRRGIVGQEATVFEAIKTDTRR